MRSYITPHLVNPWWSARELRGRVVEVVRETEDQPRWYLRQMLGSANVRAGKLMRFMSGNLSHQIEHHLFPDLPSELRFAVREGMPNPFRRRSGHR